MGRPSHVRDAVLALIEGSSRHDWSIEDVVEALAADGVAADFSSVYRGLSRLADEGHVSRVELDDGKARFEARRDHHEHVRCERCGSVGAVPGCLIDATVPAIERETGFAITGHRILLTGLCAPCRKVPA
jgi:Fur family ferric uptake transcriptional regulator